MKGEYKLDTNYRNNCMKQILEKAESIYNAKIIKQNPLGNSSNMIFELSTNNNTSIILRISQYSKYKKNHVNFELNWLKYLSKRITEVITPILSANGNLYEIIHINENAYILCAFEKAEGRIVNLSNPNEWNETLFYKLGAIIGNMHKETKKYMLNKKNRLCFEWNQDTMFLSEFNLLDEDIILVWNNIICELKKLPKSNESYGIIHNDLHQLNFFINNDKIKIFDFDDCICSWYSFDISLTLFQFVSTISYKETNARNTFAEKFLHCFLKGYKTKNSIENFWIEKFDLFLRYRRICTYNFIKTMFEKEATNPYTEHLNWLKKEIILDKSFININYKKLLDNL